MTIAQGFSPGVRAKRRISVPEERLKGQPMTRTAAGAHDQSPLTMTGRQAPLTRPEGADDGRAAPQ